jgi:hypothetical protein
MPRLAPELCKEERITFGTYERNLAKDYLQLQREKNYFEFGGKVVTGVSLVAASIPLVVSAWIAKEVVTSNEVKNAVGWLVSPEWWTENFWDKLKFTK